MVWTCCMAVVLAVGCAAARPAGRSNLPLRNIDAEIIAPSDTNHFRWDGDPAFYRSPIELPRASLRTLNLPEDDCGACQTNSPIVNPPIGRWYTFEFSRPTSFFQAVAETSTNLIDWQPRSTLTVEYIRTGDFKMFPFYDDAPALFCRIHIIVTP